MQEVAPKTCGLSIVEDTPNTAGQGPEQPVPSLISLEWEVVLDIFQKTFPT